MRCLSTWINFISFVRSLTWLKSYCSSSLIVFSIVMLAWKTRHVVILMNLSAHFLDDFRLRLHLIRPRKHFLNLSFCGLMRFCSPFTSSPGLDPLHVQCTDTSSVFLLLLSTLAFYCRPWKSASYRHLNYGRHLWILHLFLTLFLCFHLKQLQQAFYLGPACTVGQSFCNFYLLRGLLSFTPMFWTICSFLFLLEKGLWQWV